MPQFNTGMFILALFVCALCGYLLGSVNPAILVSRALYGKDVREMGSGNAGMTNVLRNFGKKGAVITMGGDLLKAVLAVFAGRLAMLVLVPEITSLFGNTLYGAFIAAIFVNIGHMFPLYFGFHGGKGVAATLGVMLALQPIIAAALLAIFFVVFLATRMVSLGSVIAVSLLPVGFWLWCSFVTHTAAAYSTICGAIIALMVIWVHRANIRRIINGTEYKFGQKKT